ncbi:hypothetical protein LCGC14_1922100 [marine sediment metagenome]|uniref:Uncharacterized protein n=1 Tax=marine sediment metagenome TaxID=412755 RepID=A0A0F9I4D4_9ZZZZ
MLTLRAAFHKRLRKARRQPDGSYTPETPRVVSAPEKVTGDQPDRPKGFTMGPPPPERRAGAYPPAKPTPVGKHKNVKAAVMKAVRLVAKHKDKRGSTAHHQGSFAPSLHGRREAEERARKERFQREAERRYDAPSGPYNEEDI